RMSRVGGRRTATRFGALAAKVSVEPLTDAELDVAEKLIGVTFRADFMPGMTYSREVRLLWMMRPVLATLPTRPPAESVRFGNARLTNPAVLETGCKTWVDDDADLADDLERFSEVYLTEARERRSDINWRLATYGRSAVGLEGLEAALGNERVSRLREQGY